MQALYKLALAPIAETKADGNSYGFREGRSCADAVQAAFNALNKPNSATWALEADITGCFDNISKEWLLDNIPMDKTILRKWLEAGYVCVRTTLAHAAETASEEIQEMAVQEVLDSFRKEAHLRVAYQDQKKPEKVYQVIRTCSIGIKRHIKIKAAANPYSPEFAKYFWQRRNIKDSKLLPALSAREFRAMFA